MATNNNDNNNNATKEGSDLTKTEDFSGLQWLVKFLHPDSKLTDYFIQEAITSVKNPISKIEQVAS